LKENEDLYLVRKALENDDKAAYDKLFARYKNGIQYTILQMVHNNEDAEDLTIEAITKAFSKLDKYNQKHAFSTWLYRIAVNHSIDFIRKKRLHTLSLDEKKFSNNNNLTFADEIPEKNSNLKKV